MSRARGLKLLLTAFFGAAFLLEGSLLAYTAYSRGWVWFFPALALLFVTAVTYLLLYKGINRLESVAFMADAKLKMLKEYSDELIESDTIFQNELIRTNQDLNNRILRYISILEVSKELAVIGEMKDVLQKIVDHALMVLNYETLVLRIEDEEYGTLEIRSGKELNPEDDNDVVRFNLSTPLVVDDREIGQITVYTQRLGEYTTEEINMLSTFAIYAAVAIKNAKLYSEIAEAYQDISSLKEYNEKIVEGVPLGVAVVDKDMNVVTWNHGMEIITGMPREQMIGENYFKAFSEIPGDELKQAIYDAIRQGVSCEMNKIDYSPAPDIRYVYRKRISPLKDENGNVTRTIIAVEDITDKIIMHEHLQRIQRVNTIGEFAAGMAHEINNPIGVISASVEHLIKKLSRDGEAAREYIKFLRVIEDEANRCAAIIKSLLVLTKQADLNFEHFSLSDLLRETLFLVSNKAKQEDITINVQPCKENFTVYADRQQLKQVFLNIILNAIQAMKGGGKLIISTGTDGEYINISFTDSGEGIPEDQIDKLFDPFYTTKGEATGLGLSISHSIIDKHNGMINVRSRLNEGSTFTVKLPVVKRNEYDKPSGYGGEESGVSESGAKQALGILA